MINSQEDTKCHVYAKTFYMPEAVLSVPPSPFPSPPLGEIRGMEKELPPPYSFYFLAFI
jgi:hypothetical protein